MGFTKEKYSVASVDKDVERTSTIEDYQVNRYANLGISADDAQFFDSFPPEQHKKMTRKVDIRLVPVLALLYLAGKPVAYHSIILSITDIDAAHIDRANIGNAKIEGLDTDLKLTGIQYNVA